MQKHFDPSVPRRQPLIRIIHEASTAAADPGVLNQTLVINGQPMAIVGVAQRGFSGTAQLAKAQVFVPITLRGLMLPWFKGFDNRLDHWAYLFARLKPGISPERGQKSINVQYHAIINNIEAPLQTGFIHSVINMCALA
jgi:hypothetical protein